MPDKKSWFVYIIECSNDSYYTGITTNIDRRVREHNSGRGGSYTRAFSPVKLLWSEYHRSRSSALKRESAIKKLSRKDKENLLNKS